MSSSVFFSSRDILFFPPLPACERDNCTALDRGVIDSLRALMLAGTEGYRNVDPEIKILDAFDGLSQLRPVSLVAHPSENLNEQLGVEKALEAGKTVTPRPVIFGRNRRRQRAIFFH